MNYIKGPLLPTLVRPRGNGALSCGLFDTNMIDIDDLTPYSESGQIHSVISYILKLLTFDGNMYKPMINLLQKRLDL